MSLEIEFKNQEKVKQGWKNLRPKLTHQINVAEYEETNLSKIIIFKAQTSSNRVAYAYFAILTDRHFSPEYCFFSSNTVRKHG